MNLAVEMGRPTFPVVDLKKERHSLLYSLRYISVLLVCLPLSLPASLFLCVCLPLSLYLYHSLCLYRCLPLSLYLYLPPSLSVSLSFSLCLSLSLSLSLSIYLSVSLNLSVSFSVCLSLCFSYTLYYLFACFALSVFTLPLPLSLYFSLFCSVASFCIFPFCDNDTITVLMFVNILIAMFSDTYTRIKDKEDVIFKSQKLELLLVGRHK